jgi:hypothetical protein
MILIRIRAYVLYLCKRVINSYQHLYVCAYLGRKSTLENSQWIMDTDRWLAMERFRWRRVHLVAHLIFGYSFSRFIYEWTLREKNVLGYIQCVEARVRVRGVFVTLTIDGPLKNHGRIHVYYLGYDCLSIILSHRKNFSATSVCRR